MCFRSEDVHRIEHTGICRESFSIQLEPKSKEIRNCIVYTPTNSCWDPSFTISIGTKQQTELGKDSFDKASQDLSGTVFDIFGTGKEANRDAL